MVIISKHTKFKLITQMCLDKAQNKYRQTFKRAGKTTTAAATTTTTKQQKKKKQLRNIPIK